MGVTKLCKKFFKVIFLIINAICSCLGVILIIFGGWLLLADFKSQENVLALISDNATISITCVLFGLVTMLVSTFGICGAISESLIFIKAYTYILGFLTIAQLAIVIFASINNNYTTIAEGVWIGAGDEGKAFIQNEFKCCGFSGPAEYNGKAPVSCLKSGNNVDGFSAYTTGCAQRVEDWARSNSIPLVVTGSVIIGLQLIMFVLSLAVTCVNRDSRSSLNLKLSRVDRMGTNSIEGLSQASCTDSQSRVGGTVASTSGGRSQRNHQGMGARRSQNVNNNNNVELEDSSPCGSSGQVSDVIEATVPGVVSRVDVDDVEDKEASGKSQTIKNENPNPKTRTRKILKKKKSSLNNNVDHGKPNDVNSVRVADLDQAHNNWSYRNNGFIAVTDSIDSFAGLESTPQPKFEENGKHRQLVNVMEREDISTQVSTNFLERNRMNPVQFPKGQRLMSPLSVESRGL